MTSMNAMDFTGDNTAGGTDMSAEGAVVKQLNSLLRGEISAAETYRMAIDKISKGEDNASVGLLAEIQEEHGRAAQAIRDRIRELGGEPSDSSGAWGAWANLVQGTSNLLGDKAALKSLKEGEEHGLKDYNEALADVDTTSAELLQNQLIPGQQRHVSLLDQMINTVGTA
jgi:uncharacterized protein (TIGR02284 family)